MEFRESSHLGCIWRGMFSFFSVCLHTCQRALWPVSNTGRWGSLCQDHSMRLQMLCVPLARARKTLAVCAAWRPFLLPIVLFHRWHQPLLELLGPTAWDVWLELPKQDQTKTRAVKTSAIATGFCQIRCGDFSKSCQKRHRLREPQLLRDLPTAGLGEHGLGFGMLGYPQLASENSLENVLEAACS